MTAPRRPSIPAGLSARAVCLGVVFLLGVTVTSPARSQTWYQVEVVIFDEPGSAAQTEEIWPGEPGPPDLDRSIELAGSDGLSPPGEDGVPHAFRLIDTGKLSLRGVWSRLSRSGQFRPLAHLAWQQPGLGPRSARPVHLVAWGKAAGASARPGLSPIVDGTLRIYRTRFLHAEVDLLYRPAGGNLLGKDPLRARAGALTQTDAGTGTDGPAYRLQTHRKMRSKELHYIDHPLFGLLVKVVPLPPAASSASQ